MPGLSAMKDAAWAAANVMLPEASHTTSAFWAIGSRSCEWFRLIGLPGGDCRAKLFEPARITPMLSRTKQTPRGLRVKSIGSTQVLQSQMSNARFTIASMTQDL